MFNILKKTIETGIVTSGYPEEHAPEGLYGKPQITPEICSLCGDCAAACPSGALGLDNTEKVLTLSYCNCIFCGRCEDVCRNHAIRLTGEYEMASKTKDDLYMILRRRS